MKQFTHAELAIIASVVQYERESGHELPLSAFYKSIALAAVHRLRLTWPEVCGLF